MVKPKILFIHEYCGRCGGAEQNILASAEALAVDYRLAFLYWKDSGKDSARYQAAFESLHALAFDQPVKSVYAETRALIDRFEPDIVYIHKCHSQGILQAVVDAAVPTVRMVHDHEVYCMRTYKYFPWSRQTCTKKAGPCCVFPCGAPLRRDRSQALGVSWVSYQQQQQLIAADQKLSLYFVAGPYMRNELIRQGYDSKRIVCLPPVPVPQSNPHCDGEIERDTRTLLYAGQVVRGKGLDVLLKALAPLKVRYQLRVVGDGSYLQHCRKMASNLGIYDRVQFVGYVPYEEISQHYMEAGIGVVPSIWPEPFGAVGIEMMQSGLPVVAFDSGGISGWLKDGYNGFLVPTHNVTALRRQIELLLEDEVTRLLLAKNAVAHSHRYFGFNAYIFKLKGYLEGLLQKTKPELLKKLVDASQVKN